MTQFNIIKTTLGMQDKHIQITSDDFTRVQDKHDRFHYEVEACLTYYPTCCIKCGCVNPSKADQKAKSINPILHLHGTKICRVKGAVANGVPVIINLKKQRYKCLECHQTFTAKTPDIASGKQISQSARCRIVSELTKSQSMKDIAEREGVSPSTVTRLARQTARQLEPNFQHLPIALCFDEFASTKQADAGMSFVMMNGLTHDILDVLPTRKLRALMIYFYRYPRHVRQRVKYITIDMNNAYKSLIQACFPNAEIILDRFHIVQHLNRALNRHRIEVMKSCKKYRQGDYKKLKRYWKLLLKNSDDLDFDHYTYQPLFGGRLAEQRIVDYLLSLDSRLEETYRYINRLKQHITDRDAEQFRITLVESKHIQLKHYVRTAFQTLERFAEAIDNALTYRLSNGPLEGMNHKIKLLKRTGYGYRNIWNLRARILVMTRFARKPRPSKRLYFAEKAA